MLEPFCIVVLWAGLVCAEAPLPDRMLIDFDHLSGRLVVDEGDARVLEVEGNHVLQLKAAPGQRTRIHLHPKDGFWNLKEFVNLTLELQNRSRGEAWFRLLVKDAYTLTESWYRPNLSHNGWVKPGETRTFPALLPRNKFVERKLNEDVLPPYMELFPEMFGLPNAQMLVWFGVDPTKITGIVLSLEPRPFPQTVLIDNIRGSRRASPALLETDPDAFFPFIDIYGQYMHEDWPGKIRCDADLVASREAEELDLAAHPRPKTFNQYGGWADGPSFQATGHFRVEKIDGKWWFIDPEGKLFWSLGCTGVGLQSMKVNLEGRQHYYSGLPNPDDPELGIYYSRNGLDYKSLFTVLHKKHGADFQNTYTEWALRRVRSWSLNTLGAWSDASLRQPAALKMPYTYFVWWNGGVPVKPFKKLRDPFDPDFVEKMQVPLKGFLRETVNDPYCIGYYCHNEIHWGREPVKAVRAVLTECGDEVFMRHELKRFIEEAGDDSDETMLAFYRHMLDTYFRKCREAFKTAAPNKLYLGSRIHDDAMRREVAGAAAKYCDVVSFNVYEKDVDAFNIRRERDLPFFTEDKPFLVGEFHFGALDRGKFAAGLGFAADQRNRGESYRHYIRSALHNPRCVGAHWFHYTDSPTGTRYQDPENFNAGVVNNADDVYPELVEAMRSVGPRMYYWRHAD
jgi:hypothetical protein